MWAQGKETGNNRYLGYIWVHFSRAFTLAYCMTSSIILFISLSILMEKDIHGQYYTKR